MDGEKMRKTTRSLFRKLFLYRHERCLLLNVYECCVYVYTFREDVERVLKCADY